jgi:hypothetical protein
MKGGRGDIIWDIPSKLLTSTLTHNFDRESHIFYKNCRCFMAQEWDPLSKTKNSGIFIKMQKKKIKVGVTVSFLYTFPHVGFSLSKLDIKNGILCYISS